MIRISLPCLPEHALLNHRNILFDPSCTRDIRILFDPSCTRDMRISGYCMHLPSQTLHVCDGRIVTSGGIGLGRLVCIIQLGPLVKFEDARGVIQP